MENYSCHNINLLRTPILDQEAYVENEHDGKISRDELKAYVLKIMDCDRDFALENKEIEAFQKFGRSVEKDGFWGWWRFIMDFFPLQSR